MNRLATIIMILVFVPFIAIAVDDYEQLGYEKYIKLLKDGLVDLSSHTNDDSIIANSKTMIIGGRGPGHILTKTEAAFWRLYHKTNCVESFAEILPAASPAGKAYCLIGLYYGDRHKYNQIAPLYRESTNSFIEQNGCVISSNPMSLFIRLTENGVYDLLMNKGQNAQQGDGD